MFPPRWTLYPAALRSSDMIVEVVVLPSLPVMAIVLHGHSDMNTSISEVTTAPRAFAFSRCSSKGMSPGVLKITS